MNKFTSAKGFAHGQGQRAAVLLIQLGTPDEPTAPALRRYLREFLSDRRVVELPALIWKLILYGIILNVRPKRSAEKYKKVWTQEGSPLRVHTERQTKLLRGWLGENGMDIDVAFAMRYGSPSIKDVLQKLRERGLRKLLIVPLYPQYAAATTATAMDAVFSELSSWRDMPEVRTIRNFHDDDRYIDALANHVRSAWRVDGPPEHLVMTFHGIPKRSLTLGDPYHCECLKTGRLLAEALELPKDRFTVSFQSRFGNAVWLQPYTTDTLKKLGPSVKGRVDVFCPGFVADCLETLEEIALEGQEDFHEAGGKDYRYIECLNESPGFIAALGQLVIDHTHPWSVARPSQTVAAQNEKELEMTRARARALGAER